MSKGFLTSVWLLSAAVVILWAIPKQHSPASPRTSDEISVETTSIPSEDNLQNESDQLVIESSEFQNTLKAEPIKSEKIKLPVGSSVYNILVEAGLKPNHILDLIAAAKPIRNLASVAAKTLISIDWMDETDQYPRRISFKLSKTESLVVEQDKGNENWNANLEKATITTQVERFSGLVTSSLWDSAERAGMDGALINKIAAVFAWQVDFSRGVQPNDRWRIAVERLYADGKPYGWGEIIAAEYENTGVVVTAVRYVRDGVKGEYFQLDGNSLKRMFLKSPLTFGRITSRFNRTRFHPILKKTRPHLGVDYGAPRGTPVMAVGNGIVEYKGKRGASGNTVKVRHNSVYQTAYKHLHKYKAGLKTGAEVKMGDVIGYVGSTGLATGPHLHFEMYENGAYVDPLGIKFPSADPVPKTHMTEFEVASQQAMAQLPPWAEATIIEGTIRIAKRDGDILKESVVEPDPEQPMNTDSAIEEEDAPAMPPLDPTVTLR